MGNDVGIVAERIRGVESRLTEVYNFCPPTKTHFKSQEVRDAYRDFWGTYFASFGVGPERFAGRRVLDLGCGSCEKATFYHDWGAQVTGVDLTPEVLRLAREVIGPRDIRLIQSSLFDVQLDQQYDIVIVDGVCFITADSLAALRKAVSYLAPGGVLIFSVANVWGSFWWFRLARLLTGVLGGRDFHKRASWGSRLFRWTRSSQEGTEDNSQFYRSEQSWKYDWFGPPVYYLHSPGELRRWIISLGMKHVGSTPSLVSKDSPQNRAARAFRRIFGNGPFLIQSYWLLNRAPNMAYVAAVKPEGSPAEAPGPFLAQT
jgi:SAM-dependent methyltransferase